MGAMVGCPFRRNACIHFLTQASLSRRKIRHIELLPLGPKILASVTGAHVHPVGVSLDETT
jgi:hypothetical protein